MASFKKAAKAFVTPFIHGMFAFAVFGLAFTVFAAIVYPPNPAPVTGVVGMFVGLSDTKFTAASNYGAVNQFCATKYTGSHICTAAEIINTYNHNPSALTPFQTGDQRGWINNGPPGYLATPANDCNGWQNATAARYGSIWLFADGQALLQNCNDQYPFACCM
ncbi:hypothetical protein JXA05_00090 [Candidatus Peregrinibacteria bacterium]|nr:hypothetical protein [Candidatus Peregrinibacteria bacterium]